ADLQLGCELVLAGLLARLSVQPLARLLDLATGAPHGARRPVLPTKLVDDRAGDPRPCVLLERGALARVEAVDRLDQREDAARDEVVELAMRRQLAHLAGGEIPDHRRVGEHELIARARVLALAPPAPQGLRVSGAEALGRAGLLQRRTSADTTGDRTPFSSGSPGRAVIPPLGDPRTRFGQVLKSFRGLPMYAPCTWVVPTRATGSCLPSASPRLSCSRASCPWRRPRRLSIAIRRRSPRTSRAQAPTRTRPSPPRA